MIKTLTPLQAFRAMTYFLSDYYYDKTSSNGLGSLLNDTQIFNGNTTWNPAAWDNWINAMGGTDKSLTLLEAFTAMFNFLDTYHKKDSRHSVDVQKALDDIRQKDGISIKLGIWNNWLASITLALHVSSTVYRKI